MDWRDIIKSDYLRIIVSSILVSLFMILAFNRHLPPLHTPFERELLWLNYALPIIFITALLNIGKTIKNSIIKGAIIGILGWFFFFIYNYIDLSISPSFSDWGFFMAFFILIFLPLLLISSIIGMIISYFIKKQIEKRKKTLQ